jgi:hypothetical protein
VRSFEHEAALSKKCHPDVEHGEDGGTYDGNPHLGVGRDSSLVGSIFASIGVSSLAKAARDDMIRGLQNDRGQVLQTYALPNCRRISCFLPREQKIGQRKTAEIFEL